MQKRGSAARRRLERRRAERAAEQQDIPPHELHDNSITNMTLVFSRKNLKYPIYEALRQALIDELTSAPLPEGFSPPIASGERRQKASLRNLETLLANIIDMKVKGKPTLSMSLSPNTYSPTKLTSGYLKLVKLLAHRGFLHLKPGFRDPDNSRNSRQARIKPTERFNDLLALVFSRFLSPIIVSEDDTVSEPHDLIELRRSKTKETIPRRRWLKKISQEQASILSAVEMSLGWFNLVIGDYEIDYIKADDGEIHTLSTHSQVSA